MKLIQTFGIASCNNNNSNKPKQQQLPWNIRRKIRKSAKFQARLELGTDYMPINRLYPPLQQHLSGHLGATSVKNPYNPLLYIRLHRNGLVIADRPSIIIPDSTTTNFGRLSCKKSLSRFNRNGKSRSSLKINSAKKYKPSARSLLKRRSSSRRLMFLRSPNLVRIELNGRKLNLYLTQQYGDPYLEPDPLNTGLFILRLKFLLKNDAKAFLITGLVYGIFIKDIVTDSGTNKQEHPVNSTNKKEQIEESNNPDDDHNKSKDNTIQEHQPDLDQSNQNKSFDFNSSSSASSTKHYCLSKNLWKFFHSDSDMSINSNDSSSVPEVPRSTHQDKPDKVLKSLPLPDTTNKNTNPKKKGGIYKTLLSIFHKN